MRVLQIFVVFLTSIDCFINNVFIKNHCFHNGRTKLKMNYLESIENNSRHNRTKYYLAPRPVFLKKPISQTARTILRSPIRSFWPSMLRVCFSTQTLNTQPPIPRANNIQARLVPDLSYMEIIWVTVCTLLTYIVKHDFQENN